MVWLTWAAIDARFAARWADTSTNVVISESGVYQSSNVSGRKSSGISTPRATAV